MFRDVTKLYSPEYWDVINRTGLGPDTVRSVVSAIRSVVESNDSVSIYGLGTFEWRPFKGKTPNGKSFSTNRLWFHNWTMSRKDGKRGHRR